VRDDFPIDYEGILEINFLQKYHAKCDLGRKQLLIGTIKFRLHPYTKFKLHPRSETIIPAVTDLNHVGIISAEESMPGIFIGNCLVEPKENTCLISIMNTTDELVEITSPCVTLEEINESSAVKTHKLNSVTNKVANLQMRKERVQNQL